jgi:hypothetical protein
MSKKKEAEFLKELETFLDSIREYSIQMYFSKYTKGHGLTNSQFIQFNAIQVMSAQSSIFDRHNEKIDKKLAKKGNK